MADPNFKKTLLSILNCALSTSQDSHICENPVPLTCSHCVCKDCASSINDYKRIKCNICQRANERDLKQVLETKIFDSVLNMHLTDAFTIVCEAFEEKINYLKSINYEENFDLKIQFIKDEIEIRIESVKIQLDNIKTSFNERLEKIKTDWKEKSGFNDSGKCEAIKKFNEDLLKLKEDISNKQNLTEKGLYEYQKKVKDIKSLIQEFEKNIPKIDFHPSEAVLESNFIGDLIDSTYDDHLLERIKQQKYKEVKIEKICDLCVLPNGNILGCDGENQQLLILDAEMKLIRTINSIDGLYYNVISADTNKRDAIYLSALNQEAIIKTDLELNKLCMYPISDDEIVDMSFPRGICYDKGSVYICDYVNQSILKLNEDLVYQSCFHVEYQPWYIKIINNLACVRTSHIECSIHFHDLTNFNEISKFEGHNGIIGSSEMCFYEYYYKTKTFYCYDANGKLIEQVKVKACGNRSFLNGSICVINSKLALCNRSSNLIVV